MMTMIPNKRFGFFVSTMVGGLAPWASYSDEEIAADKLAVRSATTGFELRESFIDRFLKRTAEVNQMAVRQSPKVDLAAYVGTYWTQKRNFTTVEALVGAFLPQSVLTVSLSEDGKALLLNGWGPYTQVENGVFANKSDGNIWTDPYTIDVFKPAHIAFNIGEDGKVLGMVPGLGDQMWVPASPLFNPHSMGLIAAICGLVAITGVLLFLWPQPRRFRQPANYLGLLITAAVVLQPVAMMVGFAPNDSLVDQASAGDYDRLYVMVGSANLLLVTSVVLAFMTIRRQVRREPAIGPKWARVGYRLHVGLVASTGIAMALALGFFNMLGVHIPG
jgi:hypothetical protein